MNAKKGREGLTNQKYGFKTLLIDIIYDIVGNVLYGVGICSFAQASGFVATGLTGIAMMLNTLFGLPIGVMTLLMNVPIAIFCYKHMSREFFYKSVKTLIISTIVIDYVMPFIPVYTGEKILSSLFAGLLSGVGLAIIYNRGTCGGGMDFVIMYCRKKAPHITIGTISNIINSVIIISSGIVYHDIDAMLYGLLMSLTLTTAVDKLMNGFESGNLLLIISDKYEEIADIIMADVVRGVTCIDAKGMYTGDTKTILFCACTRPEASTIRRTVHSIDPKAMILNCSYETAYGLGFKKPDL